MFLENSRYYNQPTMTWKLKDGREVALLQPRLLPALEAAATPLQANDRLDILALRHYNDGTQFWHIADANTELEARLLPSSPRVSADAPPVIVIQVPQT